MVVTKKLDVRMRIERFRGIRLMEPNSSLLTREQNKMQIKGKTQLWEKQILDNL